MKKGFNYETCYNYCIIKACCVYKDKTRDEIKEIAKKMVKEMEKDGWKIDIHNKLVSQYHAFSNYAAHDADLIVENLPEKLFVNIQEWLDDKEISNIEYNGLSIKKIMEMNSNANEKMNFILATLRMIDYANSDNAKPDDFAPYCHEEIKI